MRLLFYIFAFIIMENSWQVLTKKTYTIGGRGGYLFFGGGWLIYYALFFLMAGDIKNWRHWIGFIVYLVVAIGYWLVFRYGKKNDTPSEDGEDVK